MKYLVLSYRLPPEFGAASARAESIIKALEKRGHEVMAPKLWSPGFEYRGYTRRLLIYLGFFVSYSWYLFSHHPKSNAVIYVSPWAITPLSLPAFIYGRFAGSKVILDVVDPLFLYFVPYARHFSDGITVNSESLHERIPDSKVLPNGVDMEEFSPKEVAHEGILATYSGALVESYDFSLIFDAARAHPSAMFIIRGVGEAGPELEASARGVPNLVVSVGPASDDALKAIYRETDIFLIPCTKQTDAIPTKLVEYMAMGKPSVVSSDGDMAKLADGWGLVCPIDDSLSFSKNIGVLMQNRSLREWMGQNARRLASERFSLEKMGERLEEMLA